MKTKVVISTIMGLLFYGSFACSQPAIPSLVVGLTIEQANRMLEEQGWEPDPEHSHHPSSMSRSGGELMSLSSCSGTGVGYCRYDYQRGKQHLSIVTIPSQPGTPSGGLVERWW